MEIVRENCNFVRGMSGNFEWTQMWQPCIFTGSIRSTREGNVLIRVCVSTLGGGGRVPTLDNEGYLPWPGVPTLEGGYLTWPGWYLPWLGDTYPGRWEYVPWTGDTYPEWGGYLPWVGVHILDRGRGTYLGLGGIYPGWGRYLPWTGYAASDTPLAASHRRIFLFRRIFLYFFFFLKNPTFPHKWVRFLLFFCSGINIWRKQISQIQRRKTRQSNIAFH